MKLSTTREERIEVGVGSKDKAATKTKYLKPTTTKEVKNVPAVDYV